MFLDLEPYKKAIIEKIERKNMIFEDSELFLIKSDKDLYDKFSEILIANPNLVTVELLDQMDQIFDDLADLLLNNSELFVAYAKAYLKSGEYSAVLEFRQYGDEAQNQEVLDYFLELIDTHQLKKGKIRASSELIELVMEHKRFAFLDNIGSCSEFSDSLLVKMQEYSKTVEIVPDFFVMADKQLKLDFSKYSISALLHLFNIQYPYSYPFDNKNADIYKINKLICDKLFSGESFDTQLFKDELTFDFINFNKTNRKPLIEALIKSIGINYIIIESIWNDFEEYEDLLVATITPQTKIGQLYHYKFLVSEKILNKLIECGLIDVASSFYNFPSHIPEIMDKIKLGDPMYQGLSIECVESLKQHIELFKLMTEKNMFKTFSIVDTEIKDNPDLKLFVLSEIRRGRDIEFNEECFEIPGFLDEIIQARNWKILQKISFTRSMQISISKESIDILIDEMKNNFELANRIINYAMSLILSYKDLLNFYLRSSGELIEILIDRINHNENLEYLYNEEVYDLVKDYYSKKHSLNLEHLDIIFHKFGARVIRYFDNNILHQLINLESSEFSKFIDIFADEKIKLSDLANIYDSLMQYKFSKEHSEVINIFADIMHSLEDGNNIYIQKLEYIYEILDDKFFNKFKDAYPELLGKIKNDPKNFLLNLVNQIQNGKENRDEYIEVLHFITNYYIATKREEYRNKCNMYTDSSLNLPYDLNETDLEKKLIDNFFYEDIHKTIIKGKLVERGLSEDLAEKCILYFLSKKDKSDSDQNVEIRILLNKKLTFSLDDVKEIKKHLKELSLICREYAKVMIGREKYVEFLDNQGWVERIYKAPKDAQDIFQLLTSININALKNTLANPAAYDSLLQTMHKYKVHLLPEGFQTILESPNIEISGSYNNLSSFISYYDKIYEAERSRLESQGKDTSNILLKPVSIFIYSEVYSSVSSVYSQVLGSKDASLIKTNPGPNAAMNKTSGNIRLDEAVKKTLSNFKRMAVTIPSFATNVSLSNGKSIYVVVGNFTNPSNVTHGERTGACMRIGGAGESLFQFCLDNENGFHIRFEHPTTGEYISRVSGFRNGNTVFLNELRRSCNNDAYVDDEIVEACRMVSSLLIEKSKDSACPIENVVVETTYAVDQGKYSKTYLGVSNIKIGLPHFYSDVSSNAHVLATSSTTAPFVPLNFDKSNVPTYLPAREKARESTNLRDLIDMINRVSGIKALLAGQALENIEPVVENDSFLYGIASNDWYIYIDNDLVIHEDFITIDERVKEELEIARKKVGEMIPIVKKECTYQY